MIGTKRRGSEDGRNERRLLSNKTPRCRNQIDYRSRDRKITTKICTNRMPILIYLIEPVEMSN